MSITVTMTEEDFQLIKSTFNARKIRVREWIATANKAGNLKDVDMWESLLVNKSNLIKRLDKQAKQVSA